MPCKKPPHQGWTLRVSGRNAPNSGPWGMLLTNITVPYCPLPSLSLSLCCSWSLSGDNGVHYFGGKVKLWKMCILCHLPIFILIQQIMLCLCIQPTRGFLLCRICFYIHYFLIWTETTLIFIWGNSHRVSEDVTVSVKEWPHIKY